MSVVKLCTRGPGGGPCGRATRTPSLTPGDCPRCWINQYPRDELPRATEADRTKVVAHISLVRVDRCEFLGRRIEHRVGCGGMRCLHGCENSLPAVPGGYCQTCTEYVPEPGEPWI